MVVNDFVFFGIGAGYLLAAVILGVLSNRLPALRVVGLSIMVVGALIALLCWDCLDAGAPQLIQSLFLLMIYFGPPVLLGYAVAFIASRYVARVVLRLAGERKK